MALVPRRRSGDGSLLTASLLFLILLVVSLTFVSISADRVSLDVSRAFARSAALGIARSAVGEADSVFRSDNGFLGKFIAFYSGRAAGEVGHFRTTYRLVYSLRGFRFPGFSFNVAPVVIETVREKSDQNSSTVEGVLSFSTTVAFNGHPRIIRRYELLRRFFIHRSSVSMVEFDDIPLAVFVDRNLIRRDKR